jgi:hypothetical protein
MSAWVYECMSAWVCKRIGVWVCECMGRCMGVSTVHHSQPNIATNIAT